MRHEPSPASRPLQTLSARALVEKFSLALERADGVSGAHCIHELCMREE